MDRRLRSLQDLIRSRQQGGFAGRRGELVEYEENLGLAVDDGRRRFLFNIHGDAGVGKTYLARQLCRLAAGRGALTACVDDPVDDATAAMSIIAGQLAQAGARLGGFEKQADAYQRRRHELESDPKAPDDIAAFLTRTAVTVGLAAARDIPVAGSLLAPVDTAGAAEQVNRVRTYLARRLSDHADVRLLLSPVDELTPVFVAELGRVAATRPVALFFDTYERTGLVLDAWLRRLYEGQYGGLPVTLVTTICGQKPLSPNRWGEFLPVIADVPLEPFSDAEACQFLAAKGISDEDVAEVIVSLSGRLPLWLATLAEARPGSVTDIGDPAGDAVERFLKWEDDPGRRRVAVAAAIPRALDRDVLAEVAGAGETDGLFGWLCGLPFISRRAGSWAYHEVVRTAMLRLQRAQAPSEWTSRQMALARAHERWAREAAGDGREWSCPRWIDHTREQAYHLLCANPDANLHGALTTAVRAAEHSTIRARQWAELIADAGKDAGHPRARQWGQRLNDGIHGDDLTGYLTALIDDADLDSTTLGMAFQQRGEDQGITGHLDEALADYNRAIELGPESAWKRAFRGFNFLLMRRYDEALADFHRAIELDESAWKLGRGRAYRGMERHGEALGDLNHAMEMGPGQEWVIGARGETYRLMRRYEEALADFDRAIELNPEYDWALCSRGQAYRAMERYDEALADFNHAIKLDESAWKLVARGRTYRAMGRYEEALADFSRVIELDPGSARALCSRGRTYRAMGRYDEALADLNRAIEMDPSADDFTAERAEIRRLMEQA